MQQMGEKIMTTQQKQVIDNYTARELMGSISRLLNSKLENKKELIEYCEKRLDSLNVDNALVVETDMSDFGNM